MESPEALTVSQLTEEIKKIIEPRFAAVTVKGEISNLKEQSSGHLYFTLKDETAQLQAVLFRGSARLLARPPKPGDQVVAKGEISLYIPRGSYQMVVRELSYQGVGDLLLKLHQLKLEIARRGWFDPKRRRPLPFLPKKIGVITSPTGAVLQDILHVLSRRFPGFHLILSPVRVQGEGAKEEIAQAIAQMNQYQLVDVLIVGRGGGSLEDLWAFNEEMVARAIVESKIPVIAAVGHETDHSIADYVADLRAPTPSAAAEMVLPEKAALLRKLAEKRQSLVNSLTSSVRERRALLKSIAQHPTIKDPLSLLHRYSQKVDLIEMNLEREVRAPLERKRLLLATKMRELRSQRPEAMIAHKREKLAQMALFLHSINPKNLLAKGYCILFSENKDSVIFSTKQLTEGSHISLSLSDGEALAKVVKLLH